MAKKRATGVRGSWFATVDSETLPCVHKHWWSNRSYNDTGLEDGPKARELAEAIRHTGKVVLTDDEVEVEDGRVIGFRRKSYISVDRVGPVTQDEHGLRFEFLSRLHDLA